MIIKGNNVYQQFKVRQAAAGIKLLSEWPLSPRADCFISLSPFDMIMAKNETLTKRNTLG